MPENRRQKIDGGPAGGELRLRADRSDAGHRVDRWLAARVEGASRSRIQQWLGEGRVLADGTAVKSSYRLKGAETVSVCIPPQRPAEPLPEEIPLSIVFQDADICIVDKPAGLVVHPASGHADGTLVNALLFHVRDLSGVGGALKPGIVHRLDKGTSGLMLVSKNDRAHIELQRQFAGREVEKTYLALVYGAPPADEGVFDTCYGRNSRDRKKFSSKVTAGKSAVTRWRVRERFPGATLVEADLLTGRTHQIRVHFSDAGMPLLGDLQYGAARRVRQLPAAAQAPVSRLDRVMLHSARIMFRHPSTGERMTFTSPTPPEMKAVMEALRSEV